jgi:hypothetical protein
MKHKTPELDITSKLEQAKKIREEAEARAKQIEKDCLTDLRAELKTLDAKRLLLTEEIQRITGTPQNETPMANLRTKVNGEALRNVILEAIAESKNGISCAALMKHPKLVTLYAEKAKTVPQQASRAKFPVTLN